MTEHAPRSLNGSPSSEQLSALAEARRRDQETGLLLQLPAQLARYVAYPNAPQQQEARADALLLALSDASRLPV